MVDFGDICLKVIDLLEKWWPSGLSTPFLSWEK
jgi:hypothetical protein